jgi:hypothetical protein
MPVIIDGTNGITQAGEFNSDSSFGFKNRIINGAMVFDQRNAGASIGTASSTSTYTLDRWVAVFSQNSKFTIQQNAGSVTPPVGFTNYLGITTTTAYSGSGDIFSIGQNIEGFNTADLGFGTANAKTITVSFWVRSSLTGTFGGALQNSALNRSYPFTFTISVAGTWEYKTITVAGDTSGTWIGATNGIGLRLWINLGSGSTYSGTAGAWASADYRSATGAVSVIGTLNATLYITGVQLEVGSTATNFDVRSIGTELALAQRYYQQIGGNSFVGNPLYPIIGNGFAFSTNQADIYVPLRVTMRSTPTITSSGTAIQVIATAYTVTSLGDVGSTFNTVFLRISTAGTFTAGNGALWSGNNSATSYGAFSSEL